MLIQASSSGPRIALTRDPPENFCRPAVDPMLRSLSTVYGRGLLAVILTGMGSDGEKGCRIVAEAGGAKSGRASTLTGSRFWRPTCRLRC
jgi:two-component system chemotaxis response regulator CheB